MLLSFLVMNLCVLHIKENTISLASNAMLNFDLKVKSNRMLYLCHYMFLSKNDGICNIIKKFAIWF